MSKTPTPSNTFFHEGIGAFIRCNSASDALIASLLLKTRKEDVDIDLFNDFISIVRHPAFKPEHVSFKNTVDILTHLARVRGNDVATLVEKKLRNPSSIALMDRAQQPQIPPLVVELVLDAIRKEMMVIAFESFHPRGTDISPLASERPQLPLMTTLLNCSLVHSSWLPQARRAAGALVQNRRFSLSQTRFMQIIQNPCLGQWTQSVDLTFRYEVAHPNFIVSLFDRIPNITFLALDFSDSGVTKKTLSMISEHISRRLHRLEELFLSLPRPDVDEDDDKTQREGFASFLAFPSSIPSLKSLRLSGHYVRHSIGPPFLSEFGLLTVAPNLTQFQVDTSELYLKEASRTGGLISLSWIKDSNSPGFGFVLDCMHHWVETFSSGSSNLDFYWLAANYEICPMFKSLRLVYSSEMESDFKGGLRRLEWFVQSFSSITTLELSLPYASSPSCDAALTALSSMSESVETVHIFFRFVWPELPEHPNIITNGQRYIYYEPYARLEQMDELLADALVSLEEKDTQLHTLVLHCEITDFAWEDHKLEAFRFPRTTAWSLRRGLFFEKRAAIKPSYDKSDTVRFRVK